MHTKDRNTDLTKEIKPHHDCYYRLVTWWQFGLAISFLCASTKSLFVNAT